MPIYPRLLHDVGRAVTVADDRGHTLLTYHYGDVERFPYCHPVNLPEGPTITLCRPFDHDWHLGLFFAWKYLNHLNVWEGPDSGEAYGGTQHVAFGTIPPQGGLAGFWHVINWVTSEGTPLLQDRRVVVVRPAALSGAYSIDWLFRFTPQVDEVVMERKVEWGGYAGLSIRFPRSFYQPQVRNAEGETDSQQVHSSRSRWADYTGWIDGQGRKAWAGVAMLDHPANPRHPTPWLTYASPHLQFLDAAFLRDEPYVLQAGHTLDLAYRVVVHWDAGDPAGLDAEAADFAGLDPDAEMLRLIGADLQAYHSLVDPPGG